METKRSMFLPMKTKHWHDRSDGEQTNPVLVHRGEVHTASSSLSHPRIDLIINFLMIVIVTIITT